MAKTKIALTKEELITHIAESRTKLNDLVSQFNSAESAAALQKIEDQIKDEKKQHNEYQQSLVLTECLAADNPTLEACKRSVYPSVITKTTKTDSGTRVMSVEDSTDLLDITRFAKEITNPWRYKAELLCLFQTKESAASIGKSNKEFMEDLTRFFKISEEAKNAAKPSKRSTTTIIKEVVSAMIGAEYGELVVAADVNKFICGFTNDNRRTRDEIQTANMRQTVKLLTDICHRLLTEGEYHIRTKQLTKDGKAWADGGFKHVAPVVSQKIADDTPKQEPAPAPAVSEKKKSRASAASAEKKASTPRKSRASAKTGK